MKILYVITKANWGGAQRYVYDLAEAAKAKGHHILVIYGESGVLEGKLTDAGIAVQEVSGLSRDVGFLQEIIAAFALYVLFKKERPDVVHLNSSKAGLLGALAARLAGVPHCIFTAHGWAFNEDRLWWQRGVLYLLSGSIVLLSHTTICNSEATRRAIVHFPFVKRKLVVIPLGIECVPGLSREAARAALAPRVVGTYWIGMISELHATKRIQDAIHAMKILVEKYPAMTLTVIGGGEKRADLEDLIRDLTLGDHVFLVGFKDDARALLSAFDLFLHTSYSEAFGYVITEAGCASLPVIATNVGGIPEIIPDRRYGLLVPPKNPEAIAHAIETLEEDPEHASMMGAMLHERVTTVFPKTLMISRTFEIY